MRLRDHALMSHRGVPNWPPQWTNTRKDMDDRPRGEIGDLKQVLMNDLFDNKCFLVIEYEGQKYMGCLTFDDPGFCRRIHSVLNLMIGRSLKDVGDLDLAHTL